MNSCPVVRQAQVGRGVVHHKGCVHGMGRNLASGNFERDDFLVPLYGYLDLAACLAFDAAHHRVLGELHSRDGGGVHADDAVSGLESHLLGRASRDDFYHDCRVVGYVELYAYAVKVGGQVLFVLLKHAREHIGGMRVQGCEGGAGYGIGHLGTVHGVHVVLLYALEDKVHFLPVPRARLDFAGSGGGALHDQGQQYAYNDAQQGSHNGSLLHQQSTFSTSIPALLSRSMPSVSLYSSL